jgi:phenylpropionate dioxygenase-like ring-hydroxylating dioxygenase large terminal subunit
MGLLRTLDKIRGGYPGGWKTHARGWAPERRPPPFVQPTAPDDRRSLIPPLGLTEYWYPALPANGVGAKQPVGLRMLGKDLVFFRDASSEVQALWDYCPHRGAYLSWGDCFWKGYVSCPYHGATFDGNGECVEFITEGPDSKMVGRLRARKYPTRTLKGLVFVWMGEGEPVPIEEDVPPELFEPGALVLDAWRYWQCNWMIALENAYDAHVAFYVHRDSVTWLRRRLGGTARTPIGARAKILNNRVVVATRGGQDYYAENGQVPYQLYYPRVGGYWPLHRWRLLWTWLTEPLDALVRRQPRFENPEEWESGQRLPSLVRQHHHDHMYTRWVVPVEPDLTRVVYLHSARPRSKLGEAYTRAQYALWHNWSHHFNFSDQDYDAMASVRYQYPEYLSSTDTCTAVFRRLIVEQARGVRGSAARAPTTPAEERIVEADRALGLDPSAELVAGPSNSLQR